MIEGSDMSCCGVREMNGLEDTPKETLQEMCAEICRGECDHTRWPLFRYAIFSDTHRSRKGINLAAYIQRHRLGSVISTRWNVNPNSGNRLKVWTWTLNSTNLKTWWKRNMTEDYKEEAY